MLEIIIRDKERPTWVNKQTNIKGIIEIVKQQKWERAGHVARRTGNR